MRDSKGRLRADSAGAATRRRFAKLPGVGARKAQEWWELGLRCAGPASNSMGVCAGVQQRSAQHAALCSNAIVTWSVDVPPPRAHRTAGRTYADVLEAAAGRWPSTGASGASSSGGGARPGGGKPLALAPLVRFSLEHHEDLLAGPSELECCVGGCSTGGDSAAQGGQLCSCTANERQPRPIEAATCLSIPLPALQPTQSLLRCGRW